MSSPSLTVPFGDDLIDELAERVAVILRPRMPRETDGFLAVQYLVA